MAGGSGERFWPLSRRARPKHLLKLFSERTLIEEAVRRLEGVVPLAHIFVLSNEAQLEATRAALPFLAPEQIVAEPAKRDTAAAAALATALVRSRDPEAVMALLPADSLIKDGATYARQLRGALTRAATSDALLTFAIKPSYAATGFGYLEMTEELGEGFRRVARFVEKPDATTAAQYVASGNYAWNAGMFIWRVGAFLAEAERHTPALAAFIREFPKGEAGAQSEAAVSAQVAARDAFLAERFPTLEPKVSVDYAIMEKAAAVETLVAEFDWDDVGSWAALPTHLGQDEAGNCVSGAGVALHGARQHRFRQQWAHSRAVRRARFGCGRDGGRDPRRPSRRSAGHQASAAQSAAGSALAGNVRVCANSALTSLGRGPFVRAPLVTAR